MVVQHNMQAMNASRMLGVTTSAQSKTTEKLSSGYRINRAADDAAGLSISEKMRKQMRGLDRASTNAQDGVSCVQTAEGALQEVQSMLQRMNELAVQSANGTNSETDRKAIQDEIDQLVTEIDRVSETTKFNETYLLKGTGETSVSKTVSTGVNGYFNKDTLDPVVKEATGNQFSGKIASGLGENTEDTVVVTYNDAKGVERTAEITFKVGEDDETTAANIAEAIKSDEKLSEIFNASSDENGNLMIESKLNKYELDDLKAGANKVTKLEFHSSDDTTEAALKTTITNKAGTAGSGDAVNAVGTSYELELTDLKDGDTVTINGKTYTFDANKVADATKDTPANSFKTLEDLQTLLEDSGYSASVVVTGDLKTENYAADNTITSTTNESLREVITPGTTALNDTKFVSPNATAAANNGASWANVAHQNNNADAAKTYTNIKTSLVITMDEKQAEQKGSVDSSPLELRFHVGADSADTNKISVTIDAMNSTTLGIRGADGKGLDMSTEESATAAIDTIAEALQKVSSQRAALGAVQNRLEHTIANLDNVVENTTAAESRIRDTDMAEMMVEYSKNNILAQAGQSMLAQANQSTQGVLSLLQ